MAREQAPELDPDEWWAEDLAGCEVHDAGRPVGVVRQLLELPSCEVLEVERAGGGELLVPLVSDAVREVDLDRRAIDVDLRLPRRGVCRSTSSRCSPRRSGGSSASGM